MVKTKPLSVYQRQTYCTTNLRHGYAFLCMLQLTGASKACLYDQNPRARVKYAYVMSQRNHEFNMTIVLDLLFSFSDNFH